MPAGHAVTVGDGSDRLLAVGVWTAALNGARGYGVDCEKGEAVHLRAPSVVSMDGWNSGRRLPATRFMLDRYCVISTSSRNP
jgi:hypothetical protein